jgi:hypothetical protein
MDTLKKYEINPKRLYPSNRRSNKPRFIQTQYGVVQVEVSCEVSYSRALSKCSNDPGLQYPEAALDQPPRRSYGYRPQPDQGITNPADISDTASVESKSWFLLNDYDLEALQSRQDLNTTSAQAPKTIHNARNWSNASSSSNARVPPSLADTFSTGTTSNDINKIESV